MQCSYQNKDGVRCPEPAAVRIPCHPSQRKGACVPHAVEFGVDVDTAIGMRLEPPPPLKTGSTAARTRCAAWNRTYAVGTRVRYWFGARGTSRPPIRPTGEAKTIAAARVVAGVATVQLETGAVLSLDHVEAVP